MIKNCSREKSCFAPLNEEDAPQNKIFRSAVFYSLFLFLKL